MKREWLVRLLNEPLNSRKTNAFKGFEEEGYSFIGFKEIAGTILIIVFLFMCSLLSGNLW